MPFKDPARRRENERRYRRKRRMAARADQSSTVPRKCLNCGAQVTNRRALFCGERCRQIAELVRYARRKLAEETYERADIAEAIQARTSQLIVGFYDKRARQVTEEERQELIKRANGHCEKCGRKFNDDGDHRFTVQHTAAEGGLILEAWCYRCNMDHAQSVPFLLSEEQSAFVVSLDLRIHANAPMLICDDAENWATKWHELLQESGEALR